MKKLLLLSIIILLAGCGSPAPVQTALPSSNSPSTPLPPADTPVPTTASGEIPQMEGLLYGEGDLSAEYRPDTVSFSLPKELSDLPAGIQVANLSLLSVVYTSNISIVLYATGTDTNAAFTKAVELLQSNYAETKSNFELTTETPADIGDQATLLTLDSMLGDVSLVYTTCNALVYIHLISNTASDREALRFGQKVQERLDPFVCQ